MSVNSKNKDLKNKDSKGNKLFHTGVASALAGLGLLPGAAKAQSVMDVEAALVPAPEPSSDITSAEAVVSGVTVRSREVAWDVPWIEPAPVVAAPDNTVAVPAPIIPTPVVPEPVELAAAPIAPSFDTAASEAVSALEVTAPEGVEAQLDWGAPIESPLTLALAEEAAVVEAAATDFPLIAVAEPEQSVVDVSAPVVRGDVRLAASTDLATVPGKEESGDVVSAELTPQTPQTLYQPAAPLLAQSVAEAETEEDEEVYESVVPLIALAEEEEEDELPEPTSPLLARTRVVEMPATVSPYLAIALPPEQRAQQPKAPWLASSMDLIELEETRSLVNGQLDNALLSLNLDETIEDEKATPWLAIANEEDEEIEDPRLSLLLPEDPLEQDDSRLSIAFPSQAPERDDPRLSISLVEQNAPKRPSDWTVILPEELTPPSAVLPEVAVLSPETTSSPTVYDVTNLQGIAITPISLAEAGEEAVSVTASQVEFLSPAANAFLEIPATSVVLRFPVGANIALLANGQMVDPSLVGRTETDSETQLRTQSWYGVVLNTGDNILEVISTETGQILRSLPLTVKGPPERLILLTPRAIPSDGRSTSSIRGQFLDESGNIALWESVATLRSSDGQFLGADLDPDVPGHQVTVSDGEFVAELQSSLESHLVQIQANALGFEAFSQIQFVTPQRPHLLSGVLDVRLGARGTDYYDSYRDFLPIDGNNPYELDIDTAVFATGNIGEWLYTGAYNSERTLNENCRGETTLFRSGGGGCENSYATYGDDSYSDVTAPSLDSVYLRIERNSPTTLGIDYAMWGDFNTEEFATPAQLFTSTSRQLHGFKASYNFGNLVATGFYANNVEGFQRDTIAPDGTSGLYFTSQRNVVPGSENVFLELEELERPGTVLERQSLARGADYEIDYDRGTLLFNDPIMRTSVNNFGDLLVRRIVTTYQYENGSDTSALAGRLQYNFDQKQGQESWLGASYFREDQGNRDFTLYGLDSRVALGENAQLTAEVARSSSNFATTGNVDGSAYRVELDGTVGRLTGRAFISSTDTGFTNAATTSFVPGQTRYGAQVSGNIAPNTTLRARYDHEDNRGTAPQVVTGFSPLLPGVTLGGTPTDNSLTTYSLGLTQQWGRTTAEVDWIHRDRTDRINNTRNLSSDQLRSRLSVPISNTLSIVAQNELNLSSNVDPIYPSRTLIGLNWQAMPGVNVGLNQVFYGGGGNNRGSSTSLDITGEHTFASDTTVRGRFSTVDGRQVGGTIGLEQGINLAPGLDLDLGYERVFSTFGNETAASTQFSQPVATGNTAAALGLSGGESYSVGLSYTDNADFQASTRFEHRTSSRGSNTVFDISALGRLTPELTVLGDYRLTHTANQGISGLGTTSLLKLGLAYRDPDDDRFNALLRYEHRRNPNTLPSGSSLATSTETQEHLFSAEAIYAPDWRWELYGKYALRNSQTVISAASNNFSSSTTVQLAQARATYRLGYQWDVVGEARWLGGGGFNETGFSVEAGYYPTPDLRLSAGYSGGATDYDFGENRSAGGFYIGATAKLGGLFSGFGTRPDAPSQQQESVVSVSDEASDPVANTAVQDAVQSDVQSAVETRPAATQSEARYPFATEF